MMMMITMILMERKQEIKGERRGMKGMQEIQRIETLR